MATIVTDLDGTLLQNGKLDPASIAVLEQLQEEHRLLLATGRDKKSVEPFVKALRMEHYGTGALILLNGSELFDFRDQEHIKKSGLNREQAHAVISMCKDCCAQMYVVVDGTHYRIPSIYEPLLHLVPLTKVRKVLSRPVLDELPEHIEKIAVLGYFGTKKRIRKLEHSENVTYMKIRRFWDEVMPQGTDKSAMVRRYMKKYGLSYDELYVFGDGHNDIGMLQMTEHSYAPDHALPGAKKAARHHFQVLATSVLQRNMQEGI